MAYFEFFLLKKTMVIKQEFDNHLFHPLPKVHTWFLCVGTIIVIWIQAYQSKIETNYLLRQSLWLIPSWFLRLHAGNHPKGKKKTQEKSPLRHCPKLTTEHKKSQHSTCHLFEFYSMKAELPHIIPKLFHGIKLLSFRFLPSHSL